MRASRIVAVLAAGLLVGCGRQPGPSSAYPQPSTLELTGTSGEQLHVAFSNNGSTSQLVVTGTGFKPTGTYGLELSPYLRDPTLAKVYTLGGFSNGAFSLTFDLSNASFSQGGTISVVYDGQSSGAPLANAPLIASGVLLP